MTQTTCVWAEDRDDYMWRTSCDNAFTFIDGSPDENDFKFCPYCGKTIEEGVQDDV